MSNYTAATPKIRPATVNEARWSSVPDNKDSVRRPVSSVLTLHRTDCEILIFIASKMDNNLRFAVKFRKPPTKNAAEIHNDCCA